MTEPEPQPVTDAAEADVVDTVDDVLARAREAAAGHPGLEEALRRLDGLDELDVEHHPEAFDAVHRALREALAEAGNSPEST
ncbi:hypothetical protein [Aeromicrobium terrae]|jgi:hypothetical protein|uniref:Uncharacterized protein n=1 Tax=Aeromicrobium terrae TaxID=2498846 RepID=A0A5C8NPI1_9ACTN|nr:hypothetical protein [Aeromicrobium terrae]TXL63027.1 hypothetical protein FHP06_01990 [Aeromicrobium terrae]